MNIVHNVSFDPGQYTKYQLKDIIHLDMIQVYRHQL